MATGVNGPRKRSRGAKPFYKGMQSIRGGLFGSLAGVRQPEQRGECRSVLPQWQQRADERELELPGSTFKTTLKIYLTTAYPLCGENREQEQPVSTSGKPVNLKERNSLMKRKCKQVDITDFDTIRPWVKECIMRHKKRYDFRKLLFAHGLDKRDYFESLETKDWSKYEPVIDSITEEARQEILNRNLVLQPVRIREQVDKTTNKTRMIGCECPMQQIFDYIAVYSCREIWEKRIVPQQVSSMPNRGQVYGMKLIRKYVRSDLRAERYARKHQLRYTKKCRYFVKLDIRKCFPHADRDIFLKLFERDCGNKTIVWLWRTLMATHKTENYDGFMIGALISQWACQYMLSFLYRFTMNLKSREKKLVTHMVLFMDDMLLMGSNRSRLLMAVRKLIEYAKSLSFEIKKTYAIYRMSVGIDMMGYVVHENGKVTIRGRDYIKARRMMLRQDAKGLCIKQAQRLVSFKGFFKYSDWPGNFKAFKRAQNVLRGGRYEQSTVLRTA